jgi:hypothetical protein
LSYSAAVVQYGYEGDLRFTSNGTITGASYGAVMFGDGVSDVSFRNDGLISGNVVINTGFAETAAGHLGIMNDGLIEGSMSVLTGFAGETAGSFSFTNSGTLRFDGGDGSRSATTIILPQAAAIMRSTIVA